MAGSATDLLIRISTAGASRSARDMRSVGGAAGFVGKAAKTAAVGLAALAVGLGVGVSAASNFQETIAEVRAVTGASAAEMKTMSDAALKLGADSGLGANAAAQAMTELGKAGLDAKTVIGSLPATITLAQAGQMQLADAASATADTMGLFGLKASDASHMADVFATAANQTTADVSDFTAAMKQGGSAANAAGLSFDETTAALMSLAKIGVKGSDAGTSLKSMLTQLSKPTAEASAMMKQLGVDVWDAQGNMKPLREVADVLAGAMDGLTREQRLNAATTIAGTDGQRALLALYKEGNDGIANYMRALKEQGTAAEVARAKNDTFAGALRRLHATAEAFAISTFLPWLKVAADEINNFLLSLQDGETRWGELIRGVKGAARWLGLLAATFAESVSPIVRDAWTVIDGLIVQFQKSRGAGGAFRDVLNLVAGAVIKVVGSIDDVYAGLKSAIGFVRNNQDVFIVLGATLAGLLVPLAAGRLYIAAWAVATKGAAIWAGISAAATGAWGVAIALVTSPIGLVIAVIAGLAAAVVLLWRKNEGFRVAVTAAWEWIKTAVGNTVEWLKPKIAAVGSVLAAVGRGAMSYASWTIGAWTKVIGFFASVPGRIKGFFSGMWSGIVGGVKSALNGIISIINTFIGTYNGTVGKISALPGVPDVKVPEIPMLAQGGVIRGNGSAIVGDAGPEQLTVKNGAATVTPLGQNPGSGGATATEVTLHIAEDSDPALVELVRLLVPKITVAAVRA